MHLRRLGPGTVDEVQAGEVRFQLNQYTGVVHVKLSLTGLSINHLRAAIDHARLELTPEIEDRAQSTPLDATEYRDANVSRSAGVAVESLFDSHDLASRLTGRRLTRVFVSYSYDSPTHEAWVRKLVGRLNSLGVWLIFDQWDLDLGSDVARFMEEGISDSDRVLVICTGIYNQKANQGLGGAGYEKMIMTGDLIKGQDTTRFIPVVRGRDEPLVPRFLSTRRYIDFRNDDEFDTRVVELSEALIPKGLRRPLLGSGPPAPDHLATQD